MGHFYVPETGVSPLSELTPFKIEQYCAVISY